MTIHRQGTPNSAITLTEVLISMGLLTLGLLGVAAMFPVGGHYMRSAEVADRGTAIAQAALADLSARGMLQPDLWLARSATGSGVFEETMHDAHQKAEAVADGFAQFDSDPNVRQQVINNVLGGVFVIDPLGADSMPAGDPSAPSRHVGSRYYPFGPAVAAYPYHATEWKVWTDGLRFQPGKVWPIRRVSLPSASGPLRGNLAATVFQSSDDLAATRDDADGIPAAGQWGASDTTGDGQANHALARASKGDYSWVITVVPPNNEARNALSYDPNSHVYDVSIVVFYKRYIDDLYTSEFLVEGAIRSTGLTGGELVLTKMTGPKFASQQPYDEMRTGEWLMVSGPNPQSSEARPQFFAAWYKIVAIDEEAVDDTTNQRLVSLRGPEWPWQPASDTNDTSQLSNDLRVGIFPGAVAVHNRKMRFEDHPMWE